MICSIKCHIASVSKKNKKDPDSIIDYQSRKSAKKKHVIILETMASLIK